MSGLTDGTYVRDYYGVPAYQGGRVTVEGRAGEVVGFEAQYLRVLLDGDTEPVLAHPTWHVTYLIAAGGA